MAKSNVQVKFEVEPIVPVPEFIDLFGAILPLEDILQVFKTKDRVGIFRKLEYGLEVEYPGVTEYVNYGEDKATRNLAYAHLSNVLKAVMV